MHTAGQTAESVSEYDRAIAAYESALRHNAYSVVVLSQIAAIYRSREEFKKAAEYFGRVVSIAPESGDVWGALGESQFVPRWQSPKLNDSDPQVIASS